MTWSQTNKAGVGGSYAGCLSLPRWGAWRFVIFIRLQWLIELEALISSFCARSLVVTSLPWLSNSCLTMELTEPAV